MFVNHIVFVRFSVDNANDTNVLAGNTNVSVNQSSTSLDLLNSAQKVSENKSNISSTLRMVCGLLKKRYEGISIFLSDSDFEDIVQ